MRNYKSRSLFSYLLIISIFLFISVVGFNFVTNAGSWLASVTSISLSSPTDTWPAGATKTITIGYSNFAPWTLLPDPNEYRTFYLWWCHPTTNVCARFGWPLDQLSITGNGTVNINRTIGSLVYDQLTSGDQEITPYFNGYQTKLKVCPSTLTGSASSYGCRFSSNFTITPAGTNVPNISSVTIVTAPTNTWTAGASKTLRVNYFNFSGDTKTFQINMCNPDTNLCTVVSTPSLNLSGSGSVNVSHTTGSLVYELLVANDQEITPYYSSSTVNGVKTYYGKLKICPSTTAGVVPTGATCSESSIFSIADPNAGNPRVSNVSFESGSSGWTVGSSRRINFDYAAFSGEIETVKVSFCHPLYSTMCSDFPLGDSLDLVDSGSSGLSVTLPIIDPYSSSYVWNGSSKIKVCPTNSAGVVPAGAICASGPSFQVLTEAQSPNISGVYVADVFFGWPAGESKTITFNYTNFDNTTKYVKARICHPEATLTETEKCFVPPVGTSDGGPYPSSGGASLTKSIGPLVYDKLSQNPPDSTLAPYFEGYQTKWKVCPTNSAGVVPAGAICDFSSVFSVTDSDTDSGAGLPSGQGCFEGECVCVNGMRMKCGRPMQPGTGCATPKNCRAYRTLPSKPPSKLGASLSFISDNLINLFFK